MASAPGAMAAPEPATRLVECGRESCLVVSGHRADPQAKVLINGRSVAVEGGRAWKVRLPLGTVRDWSAPMARTIDVTVLASPKMKEDTKQADLPIGLLGHVTDLAYLVVGDS